MMNLTGFVGNAHLHSRLSGPLAHAYVLSGPAGSGKMALAEIMARALVCTGQGDRPCNTCQSCQKALKGFHPDITVTGLDRDDKGKDKKEIVVAQVRQITTDAHTLPNEAEHKVYIIRDADAMNVSAQNAFLKMLEEPPAYCTFLLLARNPLALLPTVRSRCIHLQLVPAQAEQESGADGLADEFMSAWAEGGLALMAFCVSLEKVDRQALAAFIDTCHSRLAHQLKAGGQASPQRLMAAIDVFSQLRESLRYNVSAGHLAGLLAAELI